MSERRGTKALELWCRRVAEGYKDVKITNMSTSWRDGLAFCAIIHNFRPDLIDFASLSKDNVYYNNELAFTIAEEHLGIPSLLDPADMVKYEVPDRFSILTYLSQYYRVFSNQEPASSKKASEKDAKPDDLNPKMANLPAFVGVPKRASCDRCSNPIFLAERISFGTKSYHRSCLKCARCGTQLTVGSFYETETDGEYCCETCPDEEIQLAQRRESSASSESSRSSGSTAGGPPATTVPSVLGVRTVRSSKLLDRISFFESAPLSDEEKTSNLERKSRMSSFLKETLENGDPGQQQQDKPPDLPTTAPPEVADQDRKRSESPLRIESATPSAAAEHSDIDVEDEFEKLVQDLDKDEPVSVIAGSPQATSNDLEIEKSLETSSATQQIVLPSVEQDSEVSKSDNMAVATLNVEKKEIAGGAEDTERIENKIEPTEGVVEIVEQRKGSHDADDVKSDVEVSSAIHPSQEIAREEDVKVEDPSVEKIVEEKKQSSATPELVVPSVVVSNNVPEETESTESKPDAGSEPVKSDSTEVAVVTSSSTTEDSASPEEPIANDAATKQPLPDGPAISAETKTLPNDVVVESEQAETEVPEDGNKTRPPKDEKEEQAVEDRSVEDRSVEDRNEPMPVPVAQSPADDEEQYPSDLNPFGNDDDEAGEGKEKIVELRKTPAAKPVPTMRRVSTNPFGSEDEEDDTPQSPSLKPPRPPPPKVKPTVPANPFGEDDEEDEDDAQQSEEPAIVPIVSKPSPRRTPVPTPRKAHAYNDSVSSLDNSLMSSSRLSSSNVSLASSLDSSPSSMIVQPRRKKGKAPDVPVVASGGTTPRPSAPSAASPASVERGQSIENLSNSSGSGTLTTPRKKRLAPAPPPGAPTSSSTPKQLTPAAAATVPGSGGLTRAPSQRLLALDASLVEKEHNSSDPVSRAASDESVVYRRMIVPLVVDEDGPESPVHGGNTTTTSERQWEKMKDNKEAQNRNRQSQSSPVSEGNGNGFGSSGGLSILANKSAQGKWKRRKGPAPALPMIVTPMPERKPIKMLPLKEIHQELQIIETQQQGLEKQGVVLEKMIRERCEGVEADVDLDIRLQANSKEVEDLIMQLFELVNEKNELFRRQAELMYLRRMHRLEQEQADLEYEIRLLMAQPERNKTDSDKEKEEALIARLVEIVQLRNEVVECLEMDRIREAEEDLSIKQSIEERAASQQSKHGSSKKDSSANSSSTLPLTDAEKRDSSTKLSKKEKKKLKEAKKLVKSKKIDSEKDADETESSAAKEKKKKRKFLF